MDCCQICREEITPEICYSFEGHYIEIWHSSIVCNYCNDNPPADEEGDEYRYYFDEDEDEVLDDP